MEVIGKDGRYELRVTARFISVISSRFEDGVWGVWTRGEIEAEVGDGGSHDGVVEEGLVAVVGDEEGGVEQREARTDLSSSKGVSL